MPEVMPADPVEFDLAGGHFQCVPVPPAAAVISAANIPVPTDPTEVALALGVIVDFLLQVVTDPAALITTIESGAVDDVLLTDVFHFVATEYAARIKGATPTQIADAAPRSAADLFANPPADTGEWPTSHLPTSTLDDVFDLNDVSPGLIHFED